MISLINSFFYNTDIHSIGIIFGWFIPFNEYILFQQYL